MPKRPRKNAPREMSLAEALGADAGVSTQCFTLYVPNKDQEGWEFGTQRKWVLEAIGLLTEVNGGATAPTPGGGGLAE